MAAIRSALAMLGRRSCGSSGSSAAASFGGRGLEIRQVLRPAEARTLPSAGRNLEGWRRFSTAGREPRDKSVGVVRMWWQRCRNRYNNLDVHDKFRLSAGYAIVVLGGAALYRIKG